MTYLLAWGIALAAGALGGVGLYFLTRRLASSRLRCWLRLLVPAVLLVPAPVPGYAGSYAPAFIVLTFEAVFQRDGQPLTALAILAATGLLVSALAVWVGGGKDGERPAEKSGN